MSPISSTSFNPPYSQVRIDTVQREPNKTDYMRTEMKYTFIIFFILLVRLIFRLFRFRFFWIWSRSFTFLIVRSMMLVRLKMWMTWMIWFSPFSVISVDRALIEIIVVFHLLFTYLFTLLHKNTTFTESRLSISAANRWFRSDARAGVAITSFEFCQNLSEVKIWGIFQ